MDRSEIRAKLQKTRDLSTFHPITDDDIVVVIGGGKNTPYVNQMFASAIAVSREVFGEKLVLIAREHPNELWSKDPDERQKLYQFRKSLFTGLWQVDTASYDTIDEFLMVSDLLIGSGGLTAFLYGAMERLKTIYYEDTGGQNKEYIMGNMHHLVWLPIRLGVAEVAIGTNGLMDAIKHLSTLEGAAKLRGQQASLLPDEFVAQARTRTECAIVTELEKQFLPNRTFSGVHA